MAPPDNGATITASELATTYAKQIAGKVILATGTTLGSLGAEFVLAIAQRSPSTIILTGRDYSKLSETAVAIAAVNPKISVKQLGLDLESFAKVKEAVNTLDSWKDVPVIDVFVHSAAIMAVDYAVTVDGFERQFAVNHLATFLFTNLIMGKILASKEPRIVIVGSSAHRWNPIRWYDYDFQGGKTYNKWHAYGQSKTGQHLFALSLGEKLGQKKNLQVFVVDPGFSQTKLGAHIDWAKDGAGMAAVEIEMGHEEGLKEIQFRTVAQAAAIHVYAAFDPDLAEYTGGYLLDCRVADPYVDTVKPWTTSPVEANRLWKLSEKLTKQEFNY
ncbi:hypothetical protein ACHAPE_007999 [Trichoderma viride]